MASKHTLPPLLTFLSPLTLTAVDLLTLLTAQSSDVLSRGLWWAHSSRATRIPSRHDPPNSRHDVVMFR